MFSAAAVLWTVAGVVDGFVTASGDLTSDRSLLPDLFAIPGYVLIGVALVGLSRTRRADRDQTSLIDGVMLAAGVALLVHEWIVEPAMELDDAAPLAIAAVLVYPIMSLGLLLLAGRLAFAAGWSIGGVLAAARRRVRAAHRRPRVRARPDRPTRSGQRAARGPVPHGADVLLGRGAPPDGPRDHPRPRVLEERARSRPSVRGHRGAGDAATAAGRAGQGHHRRHRGGDLHPARRHRGPPHRDGDASARRSGRSAVPPRDARRADRSAGTCAAVPADRRPLRRRARPAPDVDVHRPRSVQADQRHDGACRRRRAARARRQPRGLDGAQHRRGVPPGR